MCLKVSYNAAGVLSHLASDGAGAWTITQPSREHVLERLVRAVTRWSLMISLQKIVSLQLSGGTWMQEETSTIEASLQSSHSSPATTLQVIDIISDSEKTFDFCNINQSIIWIWSDI